jgi:hypothetical protein
MTLSMSASVGLGLAASALKDASLRIVEPMGVCQEWE